MPPKMDWFLYGAQNTEGEKIIQGVFSTGSAQRVLSVRLHNKSYQKGVRSYLLTGTLNFLGGTSPKKHPVCLVVHHICQRSNTPLIMHYTRLTLPVLVKIFCAFLFQLLRIPHCCFFQPFICQLENISLESKSPFSFFFFKTTIQCYFFCPTSFRCCQDPPASIRGPDIMETNDLHRKIFLR